MARNKLSFYLASVLATALALTACSKKQKTTLADNVPANNPQNNNFSKPVSNEEFNFFLQSLDGVGRIVIAMTEPSIRQLPGGDSKEGQLVFSEIQKYLKSGSNCKFDGDLNSYKTLNPNPQSSSNDKKISEDIAIEDALEAQGVLATGLILADSSSNKKDSIRAAKSEPPKMQPPRKGADPIKDGDKIHKIRNFEEVTGNCPINILWTDHQFVSKDSLLVDTTIKNRILDISQLQNTSKTNGISKIESISSNARNKSSVRFDSTSLSSFAFQSVATYSLTYASLEKATLTIQTAITKSRNNDHRFAQSSTRTLQFVLSKGFAIQLIQTIAENGDISYNVNGQKIEESDLGVDFDLLIQKLGKLDLYEK